jgi:hypothetical protein
MVDTGGPELAEVLDLGSYTRNVHKIYWEVLPEPHEGGGRYAGTDEPNPLPGLPGLSGLQCDRAADILEGALAAMRDRKDELIALEPNNSWGNYQGAYDFLLSIYRACKQHPKAMLALSW